MNNKAYVLNFKELGIKDVGLVGGKNASIGELIQNLRKAGVRVPSGFATTSHAFFDFLKQNKLEEIIYKELADLDVDDVNKLSQVGKKIRNEVINGNLPERLIAEIKQHLQELLQIEGDGISLAIRSSATAEDLPQASFAGQQETFLNIKGIDNVLLAVKEVFASLFNDRAIAYRVHQGFQHEKIALSVGIQVMVRSDLGVSGVMFSIDTETGFDKAILLNSAYGLGEAIVQGSVNPDEFYIHKDNLLAKRPAVLRRILGSKTEKLVYGENNHFNSSIKRVDVSYDMQSKFSLTDEEIETLGNFALAIEQHYKRPMDIEWAKDGLNGEMYILQARPETVQSRKNINTLESYNLSEKAPIKVIGRAIGARIGKGKVCIVKLAKDMHKVQKGDVLVTDMTDPDWEPIMRITSAIVTNRGGRTCHAAIIARELGLPAVVGCQNATEVLRDGELVTVSCAEGEEGKVYAGELEFTIDKTNIKEMPDIPVKLMLNIANPDMAFKYSFLPNHGIGLARLEFIINTMIGIHPKALLNFPNLHLECRQKIAKMISAYSSSKDYYVKRLVEGISTLAASFYPNPVIVRFSDFKSNEYANLIGGDLYEPLEENPMLGFRGAARYLSSEFADCFALECEAIKIVREQMGFANVQVMIPFVRTVKEAANVINLLASNGLVRGENYLKIIMMCELPVNALLADEFLQYFDGFSIGSNDLTQLTLGLDRDSCLVADNFDENNQAVKDLMGKAISACLIAGKYIGICGQGPSDNKDLAAWLMERGIESISLNPDAIITTWLDFKKLNLFLSKSC